MILKNATKQLIAQGILLEVRKGLYGYYVMDKYAIKQSYKIYPSASSAVNAAIAGERPNILSSLTTGG